MSEGVTRPEGQLLGHSEGVTHISPRGDGRYLLSNAKDSTVRLWDLRKCTPGSHSVPRSEQVRSASYACMRRSHA
jgi:WD40 repeat protein